MNLYLIRRRMAWKTVQELEQTAARSRRTGDQDMPDRVRWIRSYVVKEIDGQLGTLSVYEATDAAALREHAKRVGMPAHEIMPVTATMIVREDPQPAAAAKAA